VDVELPFLAVVHPGDSPRMQTVALDDLDVEFYHGDGYCGSWKWKVY
jgi:hypothetical protein